MIGTYGKEKHINFFSLPAFSRHSQQSTPFSFPRIYETSANTHVWILLWINFVLRSFSKIDACAQNIKRGGRLVRRCLRGGKCLTFSDFFNMYESSLDQFCKKIWIFYDKTLIINYTYIPNLPFLSSTHIKTSMNAY